MNYQIYQIYYDDTTKMSVDKNFIPLNNVSAIHRDWYEFYPIRQFLSSHELDSDVWYGFLSPSFQRKTGFSSDLIIESIIKNHHAYDVILFSHSWDQIAYFKNSWEQGEHFHKGLISATQKFCDAADLKIDINSIVGSSTNTVYSNYIIAKKAYWMDWLDLANKLWTYAESDFDGMMGQAVRYRNPQDKYQMKVFIQERLANLALHLSKYKILSFDNSKYRPPFELLFNHNAETTQLLLTCNLFKKLYLETNNVNYLDIYKKIRSQIVTKR